MRFRVLGVAIVFLVLVAVFAVSNTVQAQVVPAAGSLIRGAQLSTVYYVGPDGLRYPFPNEKVFHSWYHDFGSVQFVPDSTIESIDLATNNITSRPGIRLVKIESDPKTYAVSKGGILHHVLSETAATDIYGPKWNTFIDDVPNSFWGNYRVGSPIATAADYDPKEAAAEAETIAIDKDLRASIPIVITRNGFSPAAITITKGTSIRFFNTDTEAHTATDDQLRWGTGTIAPGAKTIKTFTKLGEYSYFDSLDSQNTGVIYVID